MARLKVTGMGRSPRWNLQKEPCWPGWGGTVRCRWGTPGGSRASALWARPGPPLLEGLPELAAGGHAQLLGDVGGHLQQQHLHQPRGNAVLRVRVCQPGGAWLSLASCREPGACLPRRPGPRQTRGPTEPRPRPSARHKSPPTPPLVLCPWGGTRSGGVPSFGVQDTLKSPAHTALGAVSRGRDTQWGSRLQGPLPH